MVLVCHLHKFIFLKTRKTAGTSVEAALQVLISEGGVEEETNESVGRDGIVGRRMQGKMLRTANDGRILSLQRQHKSSYRHQPHYRRARALWYHHKPAAEVKRDLGDGMWSSYHKISVVRNPWDKVVSLWKWQTRNEATHLNFRDFVLHLQHSDDWHIHSLDNRRSCDTYIRFEDIVGGLKHAMDKMGIEEDLQARVLATLPHYKDSVGGEERDAKAYRSYYDEETRAHVAQVYRREVALFRYEF